MKKFFYLSLALLFVGALAFSSCSPKKDAESEEATEVVEEAAEAVEETTEEVVDTVEAVVDSASVE